MSPPARSSRSADLAPAIAHEVREALLHHYDGNARELPWRGETDPYRILVSEVMLQQTRVETVLPYYKRWMSRFPNFEALAEAEEDEVLLQWEGLGYYRRARNLHGAAAMVRERHGGMLPGSFAELRDLPGVGEYTAGAVASIAFGENVPAVDGNVRRVLARLLDEAEPTPAWLRDVATRLVDPARPGDWNQALMELGATVCTPRTPSCSVCPVAAWCRSREAGTQADRPRSKPKKDVRVETFITAVVVDTRGRGLVVRRPRGGLLGGMWSFPDAPLGKSEKPALAALRLAGAMGVEPRDGSTEEQLPPVLHKFSHLHATYRPVLLEGEAPMTAERRWITLEGDAGVALPVAQQKIARSASAHVVESRQTVSRG